MPDFTAMELQARAVSPTDSTRLVDHLLKFFSGALFSAALVAGGAVLVTVALTVGVIGSPVIVVAIAVLALRRRRGAALEPLRSATS